ncbi:hypothetical protein [Halobellus rarus]|uniref:hypothetical protein n=1 Tax=Halobellus rarus TaxID=1126237 RepID=UPI002111FB41
MDATVHVPASTLRAYDRFSLYNSPYPAHDAGCAIDLYPEDNVGRSPVAGVVRETRTVRAPGKPYAADEEYLVLVDVDCERSGVRVEGTDEEGLVARILHVQPAVDPGETVAVGDPLGPMIRSGFFAPWVANHVHVGFRRAEQNLHRAGGSLPVVADVDVESVSWNGIGTVVDVGDTYALLDSPAHPDPGERFVGIAGSLSGAAEAAAGGPSPANDTAENRIALDGGLAHYAAGGALGGDPSSAVAERTPVSFLGQRVGDADGRDVAWRDIDVVANGERITGLSLFVSLGPACGAKLVCPDREFEVGERVEVSLRESEEPIRLG